MRAAIVVLASLFAATAFAQPPALTRPTETRRIKVKQRDGALATTLSIAGALTPVAMLAVPHHSSDLPGYVLLAGASAILLPSAGHWYAGKFFTTGMGIRAVGGGVATVTIAFLVASDGDTHYRRTGQIATVGLLALGVGTVWDVVTASSAVDAHNRRAFMQATALKTGDGYGIGVVGRF